MTAIISLMTGEVSTQAREVHEPLVEFLKNLLEKAESGEIQGAAIAYEYSDGTPAFGVSVRCSSFGLIGALSAAKQSLLRYDD